MPDAHPTAGQWLEPLGATNFTTTHCESNAFAFLDDSTKIAEVFQKDTATILTMAEVMLDNAVSILDDFHDLQGRLPRAIIHRVKNLVQMAGEIILDKEEGWKDQLLLLEFITLPYGQAKGLEATAMVIRVVIRQPIHPGDDVPLDTVGRLDDKGNAQQSPDVRHERIRTKRKAPTDSTAQRAIKSMGAQAATILSEKTGLSGQRYAADSFNETPWLTP